MSSNNGDTFHKSKTYHLSSPRMFTGQCGAVVDRDDLSTGVTSQLSRVTCEACRLLIRPEAFGRTWPISRGRRLVVKP